MQKFYSNGTIVTINNKETKERFLIMIVGRILKHPNVDGVVDYMGFIHPFGYQGLDNAICFSEDCIEKVIFEGYNDLMEEEYVEYLKIKLEENDLRT